MTNKNVNEKKKKRTQHKHTHTLRFVRLLLNEVVSSKKFVGNLCACFLLASFVLASLNVLWFIMFCLVSYLL